MGRAAWDQHGRHLASGCAWGNWRKKRHDDAVKVIVEWIKASGNRAHENTVGAYPPRGVTRTDGTNRQRLTESVATPDIACTDTRGQPTKEGHGPVRAVARPQRGSGPALPGFQNICMARTGPARR